MSVFLKIKLKSLAAESRIIRKQEKKSYGQVREDLYLHRVRVVRKAARETVLAYGYLRGREYRHMEGKCVIPPDWKEVNKMTKKYGGVEIPETWYKE